jgi:hypothetical protein
MDDIRDRRRRMQILRKKKEEQKLINDILSNIDAPVTNSHYENVKNLSETIPNFRMQNSKGTKSMQIKP